MTKEHKNIQMNEKHIDSTLVYINALCKTSVPYYDIYCSVGAWRFILTKIKLQFYVYN